MNELKIGLRRGRCSSSGERARWRFKIYVPRSINEFVYWRAFL